MIKQFEAIESQDIKDLCEFISFFQSPRAPTIILSRSSRPQRRWKSNGELALDEQHGTFVPASIISLFKETSWPDSLPRTKFPSASFRHLRIETKGGQEFLSLSNQLKTELKGSLSSVGFLDSRRFDVLSILLHAFPDEHSEILWEEIQSRMHQTIEETCLPLLRVFNLDDIKQYVAQKPRSVRPPPDCVI